MKANTKFRKEEKAVSAVIGITLMVAVAIAIAAVAYLYATGYIGSGLVSTPTISLSSDSSEHNATITITYISDNNVMWKDCWFTLVDLTNATEWTRGDWGITVNFPRAGTITGGQVFALSQIIASSTNPLLYNHEYQLTMVYNQTGETMGLAKWTQ
jgi:FlaG/FlaF family flagellin (archaellin)